jgi:heme-degrading monooxygenase HmoA
MMPTWNIVVRAVQAFALAMLLPALPALAGPAEPAGATAAGPVYQLRIYEIFERNKPQFHARFRDDAARIMKRHGFNIISMWESKFRGRTEFVYLLQWPSEAAMKAQWAKFMADEEWADIKRKTAAAHGQFVGEIQDRTLHLTNYSNPPQ